MIFKPLASSSHGNAYLVEDGCSSILLECGPSFKKIQQMCGFKVSILDGCLISHEHKDHAGSAQQMIKAGVPVYMSQGTAAALELPEPLLEMAIEMEAGKQFHVGSFTVLPFPAFHDAAEPLGFRIHSRADGEDLAFLIDSVNLPYLFPGAQILALEANYDPQFYVWMAEHMPEGSVERRAVEKRSKRVQNTHMSIDKLCECLRRMDLRSCREIWLMHLSDSCSHEGNFINKVSRVVPPWITVRACPR